MDMGTPMYLCVSFSGVCDTGAGMPRKARIDAPGALHHKQPVHRLIRKEHASGVGSVQWLSLMEYGFLHKQVSACGSEEGGSFSMKPTETIPSGE